MVTAMKSKDKASLAVLRAIKSAILLQKTEAGGSDELSEDQEIRLLQKLKKQRQDAASIYREQGRLEMAEEEEAQTLVIRYLSPQATRPCRTGGNHKRHYHTNRGQLHERHGKGYGNGQ